MKKYIWIFLFLLICVNVEASNIAVFDKTTNRVISYLKSVDTGKYLLRTDIVVNPDVKGLLANYKNWMHDNGTIRDMTAQEITAYDAKIASDATSAETARLLSVDNAIKDVDLSIKMTGIDAEIDAITNIAEVKALLKKIVRYTTLQTQ